jgi:recombination protein RecA
LDIRRIAAIKDGDSVVGNRTRVKVVKNKVAPPFRDCEFDILYGQGISKIGDLLDLAVTHELINKSGTWFSYNETRIGQGRANSRTFLIENPDMCEEIEAKLREKLGLLKEPTSKKGSPVKEEKETPTKKEKKDVTSTS